MNTILERAQMTATGAWTPGSVKGFAEEVVVEIKRLQDELDNEQARGIHTCHDKCLRPMCVLRRENKRLRKLADYACHDSPCPAGSFEAGEPRDDGYYCKYAGEWYKSPDKPACTCGLDELLVAAAGGEG